MDVMCMWQLGSDWVQSKMKWARMSLEKCFVETMRNMKSAQFIETVGAAIGIDVNSLFIILNLYIFTRQSFFIVVYTAKQWTHIAEDSFGIDTIF